MFGPVTLVYVDTIHTLDIKRIFAKVCNGGILADVRGIVAVIILTCFEIVILEEPFSRLVGHIDHTFCDFARGSPEFCNSCGKDYAAVNVRILREVQTNIVFDIFVDIRFRIKQTRILIEHFLIIQRLLADVQDDLPQIPQETTIVSLSFRYADEFFLFILILEIGYDRGLIRADGIQKSILTIHTRTDL